MRWLCLLPWFLVAQQVTKDDILLARVRAHVAATLQGLPNYTCTQTIERMQRRAPSKRIELLDVVRLEVALVNHRELYKWPGTGTFEETELRNLVKTGAMGTGQFAGYAQAVFSAGTARFTYAGEEQRDGRTAVRWDYVVPQNLSGFTLRVEPHQAIVGFHGSFWADRETLDLMRLEVFADDIPPALRLNDAVTRVEYQRARIGTGDFLLPSMSEMEMVDVSGGSSVNRARFTACRQYSGQSVVTFEDPVDDKPAPPPVQVVEAPAGATLDLELTTPLTEKASAVGDPITMLLKKDAKLRDLVIAPKGAIGHGRITFLRRHTLGRFSGYIVGLALTDLEFENTRMRVSAVLEELPAAALGRSAANAMFLFRDRSLEQFAPGQTIAGSAFFRQGYSLLISRGTRMYWRTKKPETEVTE
jgi:hypothetical protein